MITWKSISKKTRTPYGIPVLTMILAGALWLPVINHVVALHGSFSPAVPVITIESDDWGAARGLDWGSNPDRWDTWSQLDCLETPEDVQNICSVLAKYHDGRGRPVVITANVVFESIAAVNGNIRRKRVPEDVVLSWKDGIASHVFYPQLHAMWEADEQSLLNPDSSIRSHTSPYMVWKENRYVDLPAARVEAAVLEGQDLFYQTFGFKSLSTVPPRHVWGKNADIAFAKTGIKYIQGPQTHEPGRTRIFLPGDRTYSGRIMLAQRVGFEPVFVWEKGISAEEFAKKNAKEIATRLASYQPVAISTHRINYVSGHSAFQAEYGLSALDLLLSYLLQQHADLNVLTSAELGELIANGSFTDVFTGEKVEIPRASLWRIGLSNWQYGDNTKQNLLLTATLVGISLFLWLRTFFRPR